MTKDDGEWQHLRPAVLGVVTEFFLSGAPVLEKGGSDVTSNGEFFDAKDAETGRGDQGIARNPGEAGSRGRWRRHHLQGLP